jgi:hypothetical protein
MQGAAPAKLVNYAKLSITLVGSNYGFKNMPPLVPGITEPQDILKCAADSWKQAGVDASYVYLPDRGLKGGGHFAMAQKDSAAYAKVFIALVTEIEKKAKQ